MASNSKIFMVLSSIFVGLGSAAVGYFGHQYFSKEWSKPSNSE